MQEWNEINSDEDIDGFMKQTHGMHDTILVSANYTMGCGKFEGGMIVQGKESDYVLRLLFDSDWTERLEMVFTGVRHFNFCGFRDNYMNDIFGCYLSFHTELMGRTRDDRLIVWADGSFSPVMYCSKIDLKDCDSSFVIADDLKWRFINEEEVSNACKENNPLP